MRLRLKVFLIIVIVSSALFFSIEQLFSRIVTKDFLDLERREVQKNTLRVVDALENRLDDLSVKLSDWAQWDDTYEYVENRNEDYITSNLQEEALSLLRINFVVLIDRTNEVIFKKYVEDGEERLFPESFLDYLKEDVTNPHMRLEEDHKEIIILPEGPVVYAVRAVTSSDGTAQSNGFIVFAYFLDQEVVDDLSRITHLDVEIAPYDSPSLEEGFLQAKKRITSEDPVFVEDSPESDSVSGYTLASDERSRPSLLLRVRMDREIYKRGQESITLFSKILLVPRILFIIIVLILLEFLVLRRLYRLSDDVKKIRESGALEKRISLSGKDEFSQLAKEINEMLGSIQVAETKKKETEKRFRTVADAAPVMIWVSDTDRKCTYVNKVWLDFTGRPLEQELGQGWAEGVYPEDREKIRHDYDRAFEKQQSFHTEYRLRRADGQYAWVFARATPNFSPDGIFLGYIGSCIDITEIKQVEERQREYIEEIERMNRVMISREMKIVELKEQIAKLKNNGTV